MDLKNIKKFIELAKAEGVAELKYETKEVKIAVNFNQGVAQTSYVAPQVQQPQVVSITTEKKVDNNDGFHIITSPFVGTFYGSPSPDKENFVKVGDRVNKGKTLCILEAMKIMNEIESDISGEIVEICVENESLVEYGQALFKIRA